MFESLIPHQWVAAVRSMDTPEFLFYSIAALLSAAVAFYAVFRNIHRARIIEDTPTSKVRSAHQGYVELDGSAELMQNGDIFAPLTGSRCTWYSYKVEEKTEHYSSKGGHRTSWRTIESGTSEELFLLVDETGQCVIDPEGAEVTPSATDVWYGHSAHWGGGRPPGGNSVFATGDYRYTEKRIQPADPLYAIGLFKSLGGSNEIPNTREEVRDTVNRWKQNQAAMLKHFDQDGNGEIDLKEWENVRNAATQVVKKQQAERAAGPVTHLMSKPVNSRRPYILSVLPQETQARRYRLYSGLSMAAFFIAGAVASWMLAVRLLQGE